MTLQQQLEALAILCMAKDGIAHTSLTQVLIPSWRSLSCLSAF